MEIVIYFQGEIWTSLQACWKEDWKSLGRKIFQSIFCKGKRKHKGWNQHHELPTSSKTCPMCRCLWRKSQHRYGFGNVSIKQSTLTKLIMLKIIVCTRVATYRHRTVKCFRICRAWMVFRSCKFFQLSIQLV